jgi:hypothetical protein
LRDLKPFAGRRRHTRQCGGGSRFRRRRPAHCCCQTRRTRYRLRALKVITLHPTPNTLNPSCGLRLSGESVVTEAQRLKQYEKEREREKRLSCALSLSRSAWGFVQQTKPRVSVQRTERDGAAARMRRGFGPSDRYSCCRLDPGFNQLVYYFCCAHACQALLLLLGAMCAGVLKVFLFHLLLFITT